MYRIVYCTLVLIFFFFHDFISFRIPIYFCRRKPQNLTPPLSSDGGSSSTSGQSPNSQHNGSPPPIVKRPSQSASSLNNNMSTKMNYDNEKYMEPVAKKPRISHYSSRDGSSFISSRSRDNDDYFG